MLEGMSKTKQTSRRRMHTGDMIVSHLFCLLDIVTFDVDILASLSRSLARVLRFSF